MAGSYQRATWTPQRMRSFQCKQADINRLIMNYLLREGYKDAARRFVAQAKLKSGAQRDSLAYRNAVRAGQLQYAMEMAKKLYKRFDSDNYMYFHMQQMQLFELIRERKLKKTISSTAECDATPTLASIELPESHMESNLSMELDSSTSMEPKLVFLIKLILWAQSKLDNESTACTDNIRLHVDNDNVNDYDSDGDFELALMHALQHSAN